MENVGVRDVLCPYGFSCRMPREHLNVTLRLAMMFGHLFQKIFTEET